MPLGLKSVMIWSTVVFICLCIECGSFQMQITKSNLPEVSKIDTPKFSDLNIEPGIRPGPRPSSLKSRPNETNFYLDESVKNDSSSRPRPSKTLNNDQEVQKVSKDLTEFALEGGGVGFPSQNSSVKSQDGVFDEETHNRGSKGRKGVQLPGSSVVPRKGVGLGLGQLGDFQHNITKTTMPPHTLTNHSLSDNNTKTSIDGNASLSITYEITKPQVIVETQVPQIGSPILNRPITHSKKPEYVSDEKDVDDFEKYSIIKTSTTGEDYVIIGIVIVIGIWLSVFGALIFYRRAGEYWDRRHYRRMDFLVEGMYND